MAFLFYPLDKSSIITGSNNYAIAVKDAYINKKQTETIEQKYVSVQSMNVIDLKMGHELAGKNDKLAMELLGMLCAELPKEILLIQDAYEKNDIQKLRDLFHKLKGGLCYCGAPRLQQATKEVHDAVKEVNHVSKIKELFDNLYRESNILLDAYENLIKKAIDH